jgi:hypothetical protein
MQIYGNICFEPDGVVYRIIRFVKMNVDLFCRMIVGELLGFSNDGS